MVSEKVEKQICQAIDGGHIDSLIDIIDGFDIDANHEFRHSGAGYRSGVSLLMAAVHKQQKVIVEFLLERGADPKKITGFQGNSAMSYAKSKGYSGMIDILNRAEELRVSAGVISPWKKLSDNEVAYVGYQKEARCKLTRIFNFHARDMFIKHESLNDNRLTISAPVSFDNLDPDFIQEAAEAFEEVGGKIDKKRGLKGRVIHKNTKPCL